MRVDAGQPWTEAETGIGNSMCLRDREFDRRGTEVKVAIHSARMFSKNNAKDLILFPVSIQFSRN